MISIIGDLIADLSLRIEAFPINGGSMQRVHYLAVGPGGASNVAITAARLGLSVSCLGEVGDDRFGRVVLDGLAAEGVDVSDVAVTPDGETPVAGVLVDQSGEPAYLGYPGRLRLVSPPQSWTEAIQGSEAAFADGWADHDHVPGLIMDCMQTAKRAKVPFFFDPGPGNPAFDLGWHFQACGLTTVLLVTESEAARLAGLRDPMASGRHLLALGPEMVVVKRGAAGCLLLRGGDVHIAPGLPVEARDKTGAGDSLAAAVIYGYLNRLPLESIGALANATGAAKVRKLGTGRNMPDIAEIREVLRQFDLPLSGLPRSPSPSD